MFRTRFKNGIVAEFLPPARTAKRERLIIVCDGMPSIPRKQALVTFLASKGYWVLYPRYRGAWESEGEFLQRAPHEDILDLIPELRKGIREVAFGQRFVPKSDEVFVIGGSFGGAAAILCSLDSRITRVVANCPVVDWAILPKEQKAETSNPNYAGYIREAFGNGYRLSDKNWLKLHRGDFFNPAYHIKELDPAKVMMIHAVDDPYIPYKLVARFAAKSGITLKTVRSGGHLRTEEVVHKFWPQIRMFLEAAK